MYTYIHTYIYIYIYIYMYIYCIQRACKMFIIFVPNIWPSLIHKYFTTSKWSQVLQILIHLQSEVCSWGFRKVPGHWTSLMQRRASTAPAFLPVRTGCERFHIAWSLAYHSHCSLSQLRASVLPSLERGGRTNEWRVAVKIWVPSCDPTRQWKIHPLRYPKVSSSCSQTFKPGLMSRKSWTAPVGGAPSSQHWKGSNLHPRSTWS